jgi:hypothetical protein
VSADEPIRPDLPDELSADEHLEWRLSALLDGELSVTEELVAREHLAGCDLCQDEFAEVMAARALVRGLGEVEPPKGTIERTMARIQRRYQARLGLFGLLAIAVAWIALLLLGAGIGPPSVDPPIDLFVAQHELAVDAPDDVPTVFDAEVLGGEAIADLEAPFVLPVDLGGRFERTEAFRYDDDTVQGVYRDGDAVVSLFEQVGRLDREDLPPGSTMSRVDGEEIWTMRHGDTDVVVVPVEDAVFTLVGDPDLEELVASLPEPQAFTLGDRIQQSAEAVLERLGLE